MLHPFLTTDAVRLRDVAYNQVTVSEEDVQARKLREANLHVQPDEGGVDIVNDCRLLH